MHVKYLAIYIYIYTDAYIYIHICNYIYKGFATDRLHQMGGVATPRVFGWKTCLKDSQASFPRTPNRSSNHMKQFFQASLSNI